MAKRGWFFLFDSSGINWLKYQRHFSQYSFSRGLFIVETLKASEFFQLTGFLKTWLGRDLYCMKRDGGIAVSEVFVVDMTVVDVIKTIAGVISHH